tara:strand:- start:935 stop:1159 length:225 start_codon:yes stop_codon:yes gene_type:complete
MSEDEKLSDFQERLITYLAYFFVPLGYLLGCLLYLAGILVLLSLKVFGPWALVWLLKFIIGKIPALFKLLFSFI